MGAAKVVLFALVAACAGKTSGTPATSDGGSALDDAAASVDAAAASDGTAGGPLDGAGHCAPLPGCTSSTQCAAGDGCNTCYCEQGLWACTDLGCPGDGAANADCPPKPEVNNTHCNIAGVSCQWPTPPAFQCAIYQCDCYPQNEWYCRELDCGDGGPLADGEIPDPCPLSQPDQGSACSVDGTVCGYGVCTSDVSVAGVNCLCSGGAWDCATKPGCESGK